MENEVTHQEKEEVVPDKLSLFLLDCKSILLAVKSLYGEDSRVDFKKLKDLAFRDSVSNSSSVAYIDIENIWIQKLSPVLSKLSYMVRTYGPHIKDENLISVCITIDCMNKYEKYDKIIIGSGRGDLIPLYDFLLTKNKEIEVLSFPAQLSSQVNKYITREIELDDSILFLKESNHNLIQEEQLVVDIQSPSTED
jgi:uncharacterized LabA/DUF88 family protein